MKLSILSVGKSKDPESRRLFDRYTARIEQLGVHCEATWVPEVKVGGRFSDAHVRERESRLLLERLGRSGRGTQVALDRGGRMLTSREVAERLERWASPQATFVIGGPLGLHRVLLSAIDDHWSLSRLTFPHELTRALVVEQLYRALTLIRRLPYHK